nr:TonB-dependent receptor [uncultured Sphingosinicella sp.]
MRTWSRRSRATSRSVRQPLRWLSFTVDYFDIKKTDVITGGPLSGEALAAYYAGRALPAGYTIVFDNPDPLFPNAPLRPVIVNAPYENASLLRTNGLDFSALAQLRLSENVRFSSQIEATMILDYKYKPGPDSETVNLVGTQGPFIISSGAGTPRWRGNWSNSLEVGPATLTATANYVSGYKSVAEDQNGAGANTCADALYTPDFCRTDSFVTVDLVGSYEVNDRFTFYFNVINLLGADAPINPANYAAVNYNPTYTQQGAVGRVFRLGANVRF